VAGDVATVGEAMNQSHRSLRDDFEVLSAELDLIAGLGREQAGCHGTRQTGAGFAGCAVALVDSDLVQDFAVAVGTAYREATSVSPHLYPTSAAAPVGLISPE
jgi:galactokinase